MQFEAGRPNGSIPVQYTFGVQWDSRDCLVERSPFVIGIEFKA